LYQTAVPAGPYPSWQPKELGAARATLLAMLIFAAIAGLIYCAAIGLAPPPQPQVIQITQATLASVPQPKPPPPPPPKVVPPPKPLPVTIPKPPPIPSKIVVATKPPPPVHHHVKPIPKPVPHVEQPPPPPTPQPVTPTPPAPPVVQTSGIGPYQAGMLSIIEQNQSVPPALAQLGLSGKVIIHIVMSPDGHVISATVIHSSGVPLIDQTALDHVRAATFPPFTSNMPDGDVAFDQPIEIDGEDASQ
jgi:protein TonB